MTDGYFLSHDQRVIQNVIRENYGNFHLALEKIPSERHVLNDMLASNTETYAFWNVASVSKKGPWHSDGLTENVVIQLKGTKVIDICNNDVKYGHYRTFSDRFVETAHKRKKNTKRLRVLMVPGDVFFIKPYVLVKGISLELS